MNLFNNVDISFIYSSHLNLFQMLDGGEFFTEMETSVSNAETVETTSVTSVPKDAGGNKESLHERRSAECQTTAGTPELTFGGVQIPVLQAAGHPFITADERGAVREKDEVHLSPAVDLQKDKVSISGKTEHAEYDSPLFGYKCPFYRLHLNKDKEMGVKEMICAGDNFLSKSPRR